VKITAVKCNKCNDTIFSRAHHDFHYCTCGATFIDGGFDYVRFGYAPEAGKPEMVEIEVDATKSELYSDWNHRTNKYGVIKGAI
jgi:ribosomal protein L37AE/L43A